MAKKKFFPEIDYLKGMAALQVVLIHVLSRYKGESDGMFMFWDLLHFSVGLFVLASGFLNENSSYEIRNISDVWKYLKKKFSRIVLPYYFYVILFFVTKLIFGGYDWSKLTSFEYIRQTILLTGGVGGNWIPRLFFSISIVMLLEKLLSNRLKWIKQLFFAICVSASLYSITRSLDFMGNFDNIFGWLTIFYIGRFIYHKKDTITRAAISAVSLLVTIVLYLVMEQAGLSLGIFSNKYPPNLYFVAFNLFATVAVLILVTFVSEKCKNASFLNKVVTFYSRYSYEMFFFHLLVLEVYKRKTIWVVDWVIVVFLTSLLIVVIRKNDKLFEKIQMLLRRKKKIA